MFEIYVNKSRINNVIPINNNLFIFHCQDKYLHIDTYMYIIFGFTNAMSMNNHKLFKEFSTDYECKNQVNCFKLFGNKLSYHEKFSIEDMQIYCSYSRKCGLIFNETAIDPRTQKTNFKPISTYK